MKLTAQFVAILAAIAVFVSLAPMFYAIGDATRRTLSKKVIAYTAPAVIRYERALADGYVHGSWRIGKPPPVKTSSVSCPALKSQGRSPITKSWGCGTPRYEQRRSKWSCPV
jgi:hypothetical protein